jgi:hypothetical protein
MSTMPDGPHIMKVTQGQTEGRKTRRKLTSKILELAVM